MCDNDEERTKHFAQEQGIEHDFTNYHHLISMREIDVTSVCTLSNLHAGPTNAALKGCNYVKREQPLAGNAIDGHAIINNKVCQIG